MYTYIHTYAIYLFLFYPCIYAGESITNMVFKKYSLIHYIWLIH